MSGESGTESEITEVEDLQVQVDELEADLARYQDDLTDMTQRKDKLAEALDDALGQLSDINEVVTITALDKVHRDNG